MKINGTQKKIIERVFFVAIAIYLSIFLVEGLLRLVGYSYRPIAMLKKNNSDSRYFHAFQDHKHVYDPYLIWRPKNDPLEYNSGSYKEVNHALDKQTDALRIFVIADAGSLACSGKTDANWPMYLQQFLKEVDARIRVINAAVVGYSSLQGLRRFKQILYLKPDMVLVSFGSNDAHRVSFSDAQVNKKRLKLIKLDRFIIRPRISQLAYELADKLFNKKKQVVPRVSLQEYEDNLNKIIGLARENKIQVVLLTRAFVGESHTPLWWKNFALSYNGVTARVSRSNNVPVIDIHSYFNDKEEYFAGEACFNKAGHKLAAKIIYENIKPLIN